MQHLMGSYLSPSLSFMVLVNSWHSKTKLAQVINVRRVNVNCMLTTICLIHWLD